MKDTKYLRTGDVVQITPESGDNFAACLMVVTEVHGWGVVVEVKLPSGGVAPYRCDAADMEYVGRAIWVEDE